MIDFRDTHFISRFKGFCRYHWQETCRTTSPKEILAHMIAFAVCLIFIIILAVFQPVLMGIAVALSLLVGFAVTFVLISHNMLKEWVTEQCDAAKIQEMRENDRLDDLVSSATQRVPNGDLTPSYPNVTKGCD